MKKLHIFTHVSGALHIDRWKRAGAVSLLWPKNVNALGKYDVLWDIYTDKKSFTEVSEFAEALPFRKEVTEDVFSEDRSGGDKAFRLSLAKAYAQEAYFMPAPVDIIWGDGSVNTLARMMDLGHCRCVAAPHVRVSEAKFMAGFNGSPLSNGQLVTKAFANLHECFAGSEVPADKANCFHSATAWTRLEEGLYAASFAIPTIHMMQPNKDDLAWYGKNPGTDHWDHRFPTSLVGTDRHRVIGSSDACFMAELTEDSRQAPSRGVVHKRQWDEYSGKLPHHIQNRNTVAVFRAE